jgi:hypothetical protein
VCEVDPLDIAETSGLVRDRRLPVMVGRTTGLSDPPPGVGSPSVT